MFLRFFLKLFLQKILLNKCLNTAKKSEIISEASVCPDEGNKVKYLHEHKTYKELTKLTRFCMGPIIILF